MANGSGKQTVDTATKVLRREIQRELFQFGTDIFTLCGELTQGNGAPDWDHIADRVSDQAVTITKLAAKLGALDNVVASVDAKAESPRQLRAE